MRRFLTTSLLVGFAAWAGYLAHDHWAKPDPEPPVTETERANRSVVTQIRALARLEGAEFHMERIVDLSQRQTRLRGLIEAQDSLLLVAVGDVVAGVDLSGVLEADVLATEGGKSVRLRLPSAEIFEASLDAERTYVHRRETDMLARRDEQLETKARKRAVQSLREGALEADIQAKAEENVRRTLTSLLSGLGFESVTVEFLPKATSR